MKRTKVLSLVLGLLLVIAAVVPAWAAPASPEVPPPGYDYLQLLLPRRVVLNYDLAGNAYLGGEFVIEESSGDWEVSCTGLNITALLALKVNSPLALYVPPSVVEAMVEMGVQHLELEKSAGSGINIYMNGEPMFYIHPEAPRAAIAAFIPGYTEVVKLALPTVEALGISVIVGFPPAEGVEAIPYRELGVSTSPIASPTTLIEEAAAEELTVLPLAEPLPSGTAESQASWVDLNDILVTADEMPATADVPPGAFMALDASEIGPCLGEDPTMCIRVAREKDEQGQIPFFYAPNPTGCQQNGYRWDPEVKKWVTGVPPGEWFLQGFAYRPCTLGAEEQFRIVYLKVTGNGVRVRSSPEINDNIVGRFDKGDVIGSTGEKFADGSEGIWWELYGPAGYAYINDEWVEETGVVEVVAHPPAWAYEIYDATPPPVPPAPTVFNPLDYVTPEGGVALNWQPCPGESACSAWNTYRDADGGPVKMTFICYQDGARLVDGREVTGIPEGTHSVLGVTVRPCPPAN